MLGPRYLLLQPLKITTSNLVAYTTWIARISCKNYVYHQKCRNCGLVKTPQILGCSLAHIHANFSPESCFWHATHRTQVVYQI